MWNAQVSNTVNRSNATFWEGLIDLTIWNTEDATRLGRGATNHSIIDLTLSTRNLELNWAIAGEEEATGSDHEMIVWEVLGCGTSNSGTSEKTTGWDIGSWDPRNKDEEGREKAEKKKRAARETFIKLIGGLGPLDDESTVEQADEAAVALRTAMTATLNEHARHRRWCSRSKRWWNDELRDLRATLGRAKRTRNWARIKSARRELSRAIRKAKKDCWNKFLQDAEGNNIWTATRYTSVRIDKAGQVLVDEDGFQAEPHEERQRALLKGHFPPAPGDTEPYEGAAVGGLAYHHVDQKLVGALQRARQHPATTRLAPASLRFSGNGIPTGLLSW